MEHVAVDDLDPNPHHEADRRDLTAPLGAANLALNRYVLEPGERFSGLHAHEDQEELFVVLAGAATFETLDGEWVVGADEAVRFAPGEYHAGRNDDDDDCVALALGAPRDSEAIRIPFSCPACDREGLAPEMRARGPVLSCPDCDAAVDATCPDCGGANVHARRLADHDDPVGVCRDCGSKTRPA